MRTVYCNVPFRVDLRKGDDLRRRVVSLMKESSGRKSKCAIARCDLQEPEGFQFSVNVQDNRVPEMVQKLHDLGLEAWSHPIEGHPNCSRDRYRKGNHQSATAKD